MRKVLVCVMLVVVVGGYFLYEGLDQVAPDIVLKQVEYNVGDVVVVDDLIEDAVVEVFDDRELEYEVSDFKVYAVDEVLLEGSDVIDTSVRGLFNYTVTIEDSAGNVGDALIDVTVK